MKPDNDGMYRWQCGCGKQLENSTPQGLGSARANHKRVHFERKPPTCSHPRNKGELCGFIGCPRVDLNPNTFSQLKNGADCSYQRKGKVKYY